MIKNKLNCSSIRRSYDSCMTQCYLRRGKIPVVSVIFDKAHHQKVVPAEIDELKGECKGEG